MTGTGILLLLLADPGGLHLSALTRDHLYVQRAGTKRTGLGDARGRGGVLVWPWEEHGGVTGAGALVSGHWLRRALPPEASAAGPSAAQAASPAFL